MSDNPTNDIALNFGLNLAAAYAEKLLTYGAVRAYNFVRGSPQQRALRDVYQAAFTAFLREVGKGLRPVEVAAIAAECKRFFQLSDVSDILLDAGLEGTPPDAVQVEARFVASGAAANLVNIRVDLRRGLDAFVATLTVELLTRAGEQDGPLSNLVVVHRIAELQRTVRRLAEHSDRLAALPDPVAPHTKPPVILLAFAREEISRHQDLPRLPEEHKQLRALLEPAVRAGRCELLERPSVTLDEILGAFQDDRYRGRIAVLHFAGHAGSDLLLMESRPGQALEAGAAGLAAFLAAQSGLRLVFLNGCSTLEQAAGLHAAGVGAVIATSEEVGDDDALRFAAHFYRGLAGGASIGESYAQAHGALQAEAYAQAVPPDPSLWLLSARDENARSWSLPPPQPRQTRARPVPLHKPLRTQHFTGRKDELKKLLEDLQPGKAVTLCGPGGMGKSALAAEAIWTLAPGDDPPDRFPDGIIFHTFYHQPQADLALEKIARAYGIDPRPSPRDAALQALAGKAALLVLDGTEAADDLAAVLAVAGGCGVLITTRKHEDAPDDYKEIVPLSRAESLDLLRAWAGKYAAEEDAANEIVRLLGGLPLALFLAGRYLAQKRQQADEYVVWLKEEGLEALHFGERPSKSVPLLLQRSLDQVSEQAQAAFGAAGILALAPFEAAIIAAALDIKPGGANRALGELVDYGLLLRPNDSYQVTHALAHSYARTQAAPGAEFINRLAIHYAALAKTESAKGLAGYAVLDNHRAHIVAVQAAALKAEQWDAVRQITWKVEDYLDLKGYWTDRVTVVQAGLDAARSAGNRYDESAFLNDLGNAYAALGEPRRAIELYEQALVILREIGDRRGEGNALGSLGLAYAALGETRRAIELYEQALVIAREIGDRRGEGADLGNLGRALADAGDADLAIVRCRQSLAITQETGNRTGEGEALNDLGYAYHAATNYPQAAQLHRQAIAVLEETGALEPLSLALTDLAETQLMCSEFDDAAELAQRAVQMAEEHGYRLRLAAALWAQARAQDGLSNRIQAVNLAQQALDIYAALDHPQADTIRSRLDDWRSG